MELMEVPLINQYNADSLSWWPPKIPWCHYTIDSLVAFFFFFFLANLLI